FAPGRASRSSENTPQFVSIVPPAPPPPPFMGRDEGLDAHEFVPAPPPPPRDELLHVVANSSPAPPVAPSIYVWRSAITAWRPAPPVAPVAPFPATICTRSR